MENFNEIRTKIRNFKNYISGLSSEARKKASPCFLIKREEIYRLLQQSDNESELDGIRIYLGIEMIDGKPVPSVHALACHKTGNNEFNDYKIPQTEAELENCTLPYIVQGLPCPQFCSKPNALNS